MTGGSTITDASAPADIDYEEIEAAVLESGRGRWFLAEFAKRNRNADTERLLAAIGQIEASIALPEQPAAAGEVDGVRRAICDMAAEIARAKREIASIGAQDDGEKDITDATAELDAIVVATESATSDILSAAEQIQELGWTLRELSAPSEFCDALDERATEIYTACSFQDITGQRTTKVVRILQLIEARINAMAQLWSDAAPQERDGKPGVRDDDRDLLNGPALEGEGADQDSVDRMMGGADDIDFADAAEAEKVEFVDRPAGEAAPQSDAPGGEAPGEASPVQTASADEASHSGGGLGKLTARDYEALFS